MSRRERTPGQRVVIGAGLAVASGFTALRTIVNAFSGSLFAGVDNALALRARHLAVGALFALLALMAVRQCQLALRATPPGPRNRAVLLAGGVLGGMVLGAPLLALIAFGLLVFLSSI